MSFAENDRRKQLRKSIAREVYLSIEPQGSGYRRVKNFDLSEDGMGLPASEPMPQEGSSVVVLLPDPMEEDVLREVNATVVFAGSDKLGVVFHSFTALSMAAVLSLLNED